MGHRIKELALLVYGDWSVVPGTHRKAERANPQGKIQSVPGSAHLGCIMQPH